MLDIFVDPRIRLSPEEFSEDLLERPSVVSSVQGTIENPLVAREAAHIAQDILETLENRTTFAAVVGLITVLRVLLGNMEQQQETSTRPAFRLLKGGGNGAQSS